MTRDSVGIGNGELYSNAAFSPLGWMEATGRPRAFNSIKDRSAFGSSGDCPGVYVETA